MTYLWTLKYIIPFLIGLLLGGFLISNYYKPQITSLKAENIKLEDANIVMSDTISKLKTDISENKKLYNKQMDNCKKTLDDLQKIDSLKPGDSNETNNNDSIIGNLNIMWKNN